MLCGAHLPWKKAKQGSPRRATFSSGSSYCDPARTSAPCGHSRFFPPPPLSLSPPPPGRALQKSFRAKGGSKRIDGGCGIAFARTVSNAPLCLFSTNFDAPTISRFRAALACRRKTRPRAGLPRPGGGADCCSTSSTMLPVAAFPPPSLSCQKLVGQVPVLLSHRRDSSHSHQCVPTSAHLRGPTARVRPLQQPQKQNVHHLGRMRVFSAFFPPFFSFRAKLSEV